MSIIEIISTASVILLAFLVFQYIALLFLTNERLNRGENSNTLGLYYVALALSLYILNDIVKAALIVSHFSGYGIYLAMSSFAVRLGLLAANSFLIWQTRIPKRPRSLPK